MKVYVLEYDLLSRQVDGVFPSLEAAQNHALKSSISHWHKGAWTWVAHDARGKSWTAPLVGPTGKTGWVAITEHELDEPGTNAICESILEVLKNPQIVFNTDVGKEPWHSTRLTLATLVINYGCLRADLQELRARVTQLSKKDPPHDERRR